MIHRQLYLCCGLHQRKDDIAKVVFYVTIWDAPSLSDDLKQDIAVSIAMRVFATYPDVRSVEVNHFRPVSTFPSHSSPLQSRRLTVKSGIAKTRPEYKVTRRGILDDFGVTLTTSAKTDTYTVVRPLKDKKTWNGEMAELK